MKKLSPLFIAVCVMLVLLTGCNKSKQFDITGGQIESVSMSGMRTLHLGLLVNINNPHGKLEVREANGVLMHFGKVIGRVTLDPFEVDKKSEGSYHLKAKFTIDESLGLRQIMQYMNVNKLYECTADIFIKARMGGIVIKKKYENEPMNELFEL